MFYYLARRLANYALLLFIAVSLAYIIASNTLDPKAAYDLTDPTRDWDALERMFIAYNISDTVPVWDRYTIWLGRVFTDWDWGMTPTGASVNSIIGIRIWVSVRLIIIGSIIGMVGGVAVGAWTATKQYSKTDRIVSILALIIISTPVIVLANLLQIGATQFNVATGTQFFEFTGETGTVGNYFGAALVDRMQHLLLPTISMSLTGIASYSRYQRNLMLDTLGADYVRTARAKGLIKSKAVTRHALRTSLVPMATFFAFAVATLFLGATVTEQVFGWHGMGIFGVSSIRGQDINGTTAVVAFSGVCTLAGALLSDLLIVVVDPRVRVS
ncbi:MULTISPECIES: ABC transporter permease [Actinomycetaceae]|uniref:ABC transporter permease n=1 Tax=Actinomycetaceae TaxID=2049 RepID=UPI00050F4A7C|nr:MULTISPECIES: ABC transporter permease [Actinomycetaceae]KGF01470.1 peptide ABC transporter permease [Actinomyces sp. S4-C9]MBS5827085.1 ABC transporter permease [Actinomyces sp.]MDK7143209.1 ABC transporter permease [Gleimia europaea]MDK8351693.1 ABC transporter permease [Gleimia europaea]MDK8534372.1 ABC transporter permease [Gleimia europaea]